VDTAVGNESSTDSGVHTDAPSVDAGTGMSINAIFSQRSPTDPLYAAFSYVLASPLVDGVATALDWSSVDQGPGDSGGQYQWNTFDTGIQRFIDAGKKVSILVQPISYGGTNAATPSYVLADPTLQKVSCGTISNLPVVYEPGFETPYKAFIAEVVAHYAGNPHIGYIRIGLSTGNEIFPECASQEAALAGLSVQQWRDQVWLKWDKDMMVYEKSLNPTMQIESPMTQYTDTTWTDSEAANAVAQGFGFGSQGLQASDISKYPTCTGDWCNLFDKYAGQAPLLQLSTLDLTDPSGTCTPSCVAPGQKATGALPPLLAFAVQHHANTFEAYPQDLLIAFDPSYPGYATYHSAYSAAIAAARR
jgi:hypothetical protein